jgi:hypothetical protein
MVTLPQIQLAEKENCNYLKSLLGIETLLGRRGSG